MKSFIISLVVTAALAAEPNPPNWDSNRVKVVDPYDGRGCQGLADSLFGEMGGSCNHGQWSSSRYAVLLKAGFHNCHLKVGYYTSIIGMGRDPTKTEVRVLESPDGCDNPHNGALCNFWRSVENIHTGYHGTTQWHVSQAAPMRRVQIEGNMQLGQGYSSGGYLANSNIKGTVNAASQQQWFNRNNNQNRWVGGAWSFVHLGCIGAPNNYCGHGAAHSNIPNTPIIAEKPYIIESGNRYTLVVPDYERNKHGYKWDGPEKEIPFDQVYVANERDSAATINSKLNYLNYVVLQPGNYRFSEPIKINKDRQVILGIGMPILQSTRGNCVVEVGDHVGVRLAGFIMEPGSNTPGETLLRWGTTANSGSENEPGVISDVFARVGGSTNSANNPRQVKRMIQINGSHVVIDHTWLWRADHDVQGSVRYSRNYCATGLEVNGNNVRAYGLFVEHTLGNMVEWSGEDGEVYFYQSELPYDVDQNNYANKGYHSYHVADHVTRHRAYGAGVYSFFRDHNVHMDTGIKAPSGSGIMFYNAFNRMLSGNGGISHVLNNQGGSAYNQGMSYLCGAHSDNTVVG